MTKAGMQIRLIKTEQDHKAAVARIETLMSAVPDTPEGDELEVLATLVDAYEAQHHIMDAPDPVSAFQFRMEQQQLSRKDLEPFIGSRARVSEVLTGKRSLTLEMVRPVKSGLGISADLLIPPAPALGTGSRDRAADLRAWRVRRERRLEEFGEGRGNGLI